MMPARGTAGRGVPSVTPAGIGIGWPRSTLVPERCAPPGLPPSVAKAQTHMRCHQPTSGMWPSSARSDLNGLRHHAPRLCTTRPIRCVHARTRRRPVPPRNHRGGQRRRFNGPAFTAEPPPPQPGARPDVLRVLSRSVGTGPKTAGSDAGSQAGDTFSSVISLHTVRVRTVDGMRYAHRHRIRCTPVRVTASLTPHTEPA